MECNDFVQIVSIQRAEDLTSISQVPKKHKKTWQNNPFIFVEYYCELKFGCFKPNLVNISILYRLKTPENQMFPGFFRR